MAGRRTCRSPCQNPLPTREDELTGGTPGVALTNNNSIPSHTSTILRAFTSTSAIAPISTMFVAKYTNEDL